MIIVLKPECSKEQVLMFTDMLTSQYNVKVNKWEGVHSTVLGLIGDTTQIDIDYIDAQDFVESVKRVQEPYKKANRKFHPENTVIELSNGVKIGDGSLQIMAEYALLSQKNRLLKSQRELSFPVRQSFEAAHLSQEPHHMLSRVLKPKALTFESCKKGNRLAYSYRDYESFPHRHV